MTENIEVFSQNCIRVQSEAGPVYVDPYQMKEAPKDAAFILITHEHYDHFSPEDIAKVACADTVMVVPEKMEKKAQEEAGSYVSRIETMAQTDARTLGALEIETIPAYNKLKPFHPKSAGGVGYILTVGGVRIYIAGDTDATKEAEAVKCDVALVPIGGTFTTDAKAAAELVNIIQPKIAIPVHYGTGVGDPSDGDTFAANVKEPVKVEFKIRF
ncbi:MAG: MBL fold metallo-hydrolase [Lachnospiraceae bacterium]|nr:MBL fold metallo-hydrolase [Lachnospiraceae bacterium]